MKKNNFAQFSQTNVFNSVSDSKLYVTVGYLNIQYRSMLNTSENGVVIGLGYETPVLSAYNLYVDSQLNYSLILDDSGIGYATIHIIDLPIHLKHKFDINNQLSLFADGGPAVSIGVAGEAKLADKKIQVFGKEGFVKRTDLKLGIGGGVEFNDKIALRVGYDMGLLNLSKIPLITAKINYLTVGLRYSF